MSAQPTSIRPSFRRVIALAGIAVIAAVLAPTVMASADDEPLPGAPIERTAKQGVVNAGPGQVRVAPRGEALGGVAPNTNGGGTVADGNLSTPEGLPNRIRGGVACANIASGFSAYKSVMAC